MLDSCLKCGGHLDFAQDDTAAWCPACRHLYILKGEDEDYCPPKYSADEFSEESFFPGG
jgi:DNA-directed RNA polymerase subunit RPC12/RpoP